MWQLTNAVESVHKVGICHRDLKPDNIMIREENIDLSGKPSFEALRYLTLIDFNVAVDTKKTADGLI